MYEPEPTSDQFPFVPEMTMGEYGEPLDSKFKAYDETGVPTSGAPETVRLYDKYGKVWEDILLSEYEDRFFNGWASEIKKNDLRLEKDIEDE